MEYANKDLCAELYKLKPEWAETDKFWFYENSHPDLAEWELTSHDMSGRALPAYSLGYLIRKLYPAGTVLRWGVDFESRPDAGRNKWFIFAMDDKTDIRLWSESPEDAACSLAIKLIKEGML